MRMNRLRYGIRCIRPFTRINRVKKAVLLKMLLVGLTLFGISRFLFGGNGTLEQLFSYGLYPFINLQRAVVTHLKGWIEERGISADLAHTLEQEQQRYQELQKELI